MANRGWQFDLCLTIALNVRVIRIDDPPFLFSTSCKLMDGSQMTGQPETTTAGALPPDNIDEVTSELPVGIRADFSPVTQSQDVQRTFKRIIEPSHFGSYQAQEAFDSAVKAADEGDEEGAVEHYLNASNLAETAREWYIAAVACQRVGDFLRTPTPPFDLERAFRMYRRAVGAYHNCGLYAEARELSYRLMATRMKRARELRIPWWHRLELFAFWAIAGFGYRPLRVVASAIVFVLCYAMLYWSIDGITSSVTGTQITFQHAVYFSGTTFSTVGYGDFVPAPHAQLIALTEAALGSLTMGLFVAVLAQRLNNS